MESHHVSKDRLVLAAIVKSLKLIGLSIVSIDTPGVICSMTPKKKRAETGKYGITTDWSMILHLSDGRILSIYGASAEDTYEGFSITENPKPFEYERDNNLNVSGFFKDCLNKKIVDFKIETYDVEWIKSNETLDHRSPKSLILILKDGTKLIFTNPIMDGYMDFDVELPKE